MRKFTIGAFFTGAALILILIIAGLCTTSIEAGHAGIQYNRNGGLEQEVLGQGWHTVSPLIRVTEYPVATETVEFKDLKVGTSDGKPITTTFVFNYHMDTQHLPSIFNKFRGQSAETIEQGFLKQRITEVAKGVTTKYSVLEVLGEKSQEISLAIQKGFADDVKDIGFIIESVTFTPPAPDDNTAKAIQSKVDAQQKLEQQKVELEQSKIIADQQRVQAQGNADKALIEAQGQAKANEVVKQSLTQELIQMEIAKKWDGKLPQVSGGNTPMVQLPATPSASK